MKDGLLTWNRTRPKEKTPMKTNARIEEDDEDTPTGILWQRVLSDELSTRTQ